MKELPEIILNAWAKRDAAAVLTTISADGKPNTIYVNWCGIMDKSHVLIGDVEFGKTLSNIKDGSPEASFLFFAPGFAAYQLKGRMNYVTEGPVFEKGRALSDSDAILRGVAAIEITEAFKGSHRLM